MRYVFCACVYNNISFASSFACSNMYVCMYTSLYVNIVSLLLFLYMFYSKEENFLDNVQSRNTIFLINCGTHVPLLKVPG